MLSAQVKGSTGIVKAVWLSYWPTVSALPAISWKVDVMMKSAVCAARQCAGEHAIEVQRGNCQNVCQGEGCSVNPSNNARRKARQNQILV